MQKQIHVKTGAVFAVLLAAVAAGCGGGGGALPPPTTQPALVFDSVPAYGSFDNLKGRAFNVDPSKYNIAVYIYVNGWWSKPYWEEAQRLTTIDSDGEWTCDITTGGVDEQATRIAAYLVPAGYMPAAAAGEALVPADVVVHAVASLEVKRDDAGYVRVISFSGYEWMVKHSTFPVAPPAMGNYFSDSPGNVWIDAQGRLHLKISSLEGRWYCPEVACSSSFGYGTYEFTLASDPASLDKNVVLGLFTWDDSPDQWHREIDIEYSRWGEAGAQNAQFVVQPWDQAGHRTRFTCPALTGQSISSFTWRSDRVAFAVAQGETQIFSWTYTGTGIPTHANEHPRINLWLADSSSVPPSDGKEVEVVVASFRFTP